MKCPFVRISEFFSGERAGRSVADRAKASLFDHTCDTMADMVDCATEQLPHVILFAWIIFLSVFLPISLPVVAYLRRRRDRMELSEWESKQK